MGSEALFCVKLGMPLTSSGIGIKLEFCFRHIAWARFKTDHTKEALESEKEKLFFEIRD